MAGRPKGKQPLDQQLMKVRAREYADDAMRTIATELGNESADIRLRAAREILDRAYGKPQQMIGTDVDTPLKMVIEWANQSKG